MTAPSSTNAARALRVMCVARGFGIAMNWAREVTHRGLVPVYSVRICPPGQRGCSAYDKDPATAVRLARAWLDKHHPRRPGAKPGNRNAAGKRTRPMHRAEAA